MKNKVRFFGNGDEPEIRGQICYESPAIEHTLCGITLDEDSKTAGE